MRSGHDMQLLEAVPNVSVGQDGPVLRALVAAVEQGIARGAARDGSSALLADLHRDVDHDRSVLTLLGRGEALAVGLEALARACIERLDVQVGFGVHPRIGALDVLPVIALDDSPTARRAAHQLVERIAGVLGSELSVPVIRYALDHDGVRVAGAANTGEVRRGGAVQVARRLASGELARIAGPALPHPTAGCTIAGVRPVLIACNVVLDDRDLEAAATIAARIREAGQTQDSLPGVRALAFRLDARGLVQVSTNIERHREAGPADVLRAVHRLAAARGIDVVEAELVGLAPNAALEPLRVACGDLGIPLRAAANPSLEHAMRQA